MTSASRFDLPFVPICDAVSDTVDDDCEVDFDGVALSTTVTIELDGEPLLAQRGDTVATALLRQGRLAFGHHSVSGEPVGPLCLMGSCFACLCEIDGRPGSQACLEPVRDGLIVRIRSTS